MGRGVEKIVEGKIFAEDGKIGKIEKLKEKEKEGKLRVQN